MHTMMMQDLFADDPNQPEHFRIGEEAVLLKRLALDDAHALMADINAIARQSPWRNMVTPGGRSMSVATTGCGPLSWVSDARGYRYAANDPLTGAPWPPVPARWLELAHKAKQLAGFENTPAPDACLINRYAPGTRLSLHQDRDEQDFSAPIVSFSLGLPAQFLWGGDARGDRVQTVPLEHGDVLVWGGVDRLRFHGVRPVAQGVHPLCGAFRFNITLRTAN